MVDHKGGRVDTEDWLGLIVRARHWRALGVVAGTFAHTPHLECLHVLGEVEGHSSCAWRWTGTAIYAIPRLAVVRRTRHNLVLDATLSEARARWFVGIVRS